MRHVQGAEKEEERRRWGGLTARPPARRLRHGQGSHGCSFPLPKNPWIPATSFPVSKMRRRWSTHRTTSASWGHREPAGRDRDTRGARRTSNKLQYCSSNIVPAHMPKPPDHSSPRSCPVAACRPSNRERGRDTSPRLSGLVHLLCLPVRLSIHPFFSAFCIDPQTPSLPPSLPVSRPVD